MLRIEMKGIEKAIQVLSKLERQLPGKIEEKLREVALTVEATAKNLAPVRTGRLRDSIQAEVREKKIVLKSDVEYAGFVEYGTRFMAPRSFMRQALQTHLQDVKDALRRAFQEALP